MDLKLELRDHILVAEVSRQLTLLLLDASAVDGELSGFERYELGKTIAEYCVAHGWFYRVAVLGSEPAVTGFGELVAPNRGLVTERFTDRRKA
jgi:hypothetical protein